MWPDVFWEKKRNIEKNRQLSCLFFPSDLINQYEDDTFKNTGDCDTPPDPVETQRSRDKRKGKRDPRTIQRDAHDGRRECLSKTGESSGGRDLHAHEKLGHAKDPQIVYSHREDICLRDKDPEDRFREDDQHKRAEGSPQKDDHHGFLIAFSCAGQIAGAKILGDEGIDRSGKSVGSHPGDGLNLGSDFLNSHSGISESRNHPGDDHGDRSKEHVLQGRRKTDADDFLNCRKRRASQEMEAEKDLRLIFNRKDEHACDYCLGKYSGDGRSQYAEMRERTDAKDQNRVQYDVDDQAGGCRKEGRPAVPHGRKNPGQHLVEERKDDKSACHGQINLGIFYDGRGVQTEKSDKWNLEYNA